MSIASQLHTELLLKLLIYSVSCQKIMEFILDCKFKSMQGKAFHSLESLQK